MLFSLLLSFIFSKLVIMLHHPKVTIKLTSMNVVSTASVTEWAPVNAEGEIFLIFSGSGFYTLKMGILVPCYLKIWKMFFKILEFLICEIAILIISGLWGLKRK